MTDRRLERWVWIEVGVGAAEQAIRVTPLAVRAFGRALPLPVWLQRTIERPAPWLPEAVRVDRSEVDDDGDVVVHGALSTTVVPVDMARLLADLGAEGTMTALRIVTGEW